MATVEECDACYRRRRRASSSGRFGQTGRPPRDGEVYKVRVATDRGSQSFYYTDYEVAAAKAEGAGSSLRFFGRYLLEEASSQVLPPRSA